MYNLKCFSPSLCSGQFINFRGIFMPWPQLISWQLLQRQFRTFCFICFIFRLWLPVYPCPLILLPFFNLAPFPGEKEERWCSGKMGREMEGGGNDWSFEKL